MPGPPVLVHPHRRRPGAETDRLTQRLTWMVSPGDARRVAELAGTPSWRPEAVRTVPTGAGTVLLVHSGRASVAEVTAGDAVAVVLVAGRVARWADAAADRVRHLFGDRRADRRRIFAALVPAAVLLLAGIDPGLPGNLNASALVSLALAPVWLQHVRRFRGAGVLLALGAAALATGTVLAMTSGVDHEWSRPQATDQVMLVLAVLGTIGVVCWARVVMPVWCIPLVLGTGMLLGAVPQLGSTANAVKFLLVFPLSLVVLALCDARGRRWPAVVACGALAVVCIVNDGRSAMSFLLATAAVVLWQATREGRRAVSRLGTVGAVIAAAVAGYVLLTDLLLSGALGAGVAARSQAQVDQSGSLLLGGRPEWSGTAQLMSERFTGFGLGTVPTETDVTTIKQGFAALRIPTADGYIENYLTAGRFELHSVVADLWVWLGLPGLALGLLAAALVVWGLVDRVSASAAPAVLVYIGLNALWYLAFGPLPSNGPEVSVAIGLCLLALPRTQRALPVQPVVGRQSPVPVG
jgi:hypothetical protein